MTFAPTALKLLAGAAALAASLSAQATSYTYALAPGSLLLGSALDGSFAGSDADGDGAIGLSELSFFEVSYAGPTSGFTIVGTPLSFDFDIAATQLSFAIADATFQSAAATTYDGGSYAVLSADGPDAGTGPMTISAVPEPGTSALMAGGLAALLAVGTRRRQLRR